MQTDDHVFLKKFDGRDFLIFLLYVNDMMIIGWNHIKMGMLKKALSRSFSMKRYGSGKTDLEDGHSSRLDEEIVVAVTGEISDKGAPKVQHGGC